MHPALKAFKKYDPGLFACAFEWVQEGWGLEMEPTVEQIAAALFMEARTQDDCVKAGESAPEHPNRLREWGYRLLNFVHAPEMYCTLTDNNPERRTKLDVRIAHENGWINVYPKGYGDHGTEDGYGCPVGIEVYNKHLRLVVHGDINVEDPTQIIDLEPARETNRKE